MKWPKKMYISDGFKITYMIRWTLLTVPWFSLKIHKFLSSDNDCMHDHPWSFISIILKGSYTEETPAGKKLYKSGRVLFRKATYRHRILVDKPCWSFVITFRHTRRWGFWTKDGWVHWMKYITGGNRGGHC